MHESIKSRTGWLWSRLLRALGSTSGQNGSDAMQVAHSDAPYPPGYLQKLRTTTLQRLLKVHQIDLSNYVRYGNEQRITDGAVTVAELVDDCRRSMLAIEDELDRRGIRRL